MNQDSFFTMVPMYEEENFISFADRELSAPDGDVNSRAVDRLMNELIDGMIGNRNFITTEQAMKLKSHISPIYFNNDTLLKMLNRMISNKEDGRIYIAVLLLKFAFQINNITVDLDKPEARFFWKWYMSGREYPDEGLTIEKEDKNALKMRELYMMWLLSIKGERNYANKINELYRGEERIFETYDPEFIILAFYKGFLDRRSVRRYMGYVLTLPAEKYMVIAPMLMRMEGEE